MHAGWLWRDCTTPLSRHLLTPWL